MNGKITASLSPMAGYTDAPFRRICSSFGTAYTVSEMISSVAMVRNDRKTAALAKIESGEAPCVLQIFGHEPEIMARAAEMLLSGNFNGCDYSSPPAGIDINMGCPVKKIVSSHDGCAMMTDVKNSAHVVSAVSEVCARHGVPLSVKIRLGMDDSSINAPMFAAEMVRAGAGKITLHCRTREQMYMPSAMPEYCAMVREEMDRVNPGAILVGNGDIESLSDAKKYLSYGCSEVAIGRGALGFPWIFKALSSPEDFIPPSQEEIIELAVNFVSEVVRLKGEEVGIRESRGRAAHFIKGMRGSASVRERLNHASTEEEFREILLELNGGENG